jgi:DNA-binding SARP family transcriptional activator/Tfp pilus assembly protein PilF
VHTTRAGRPRGAQTRERRPTTSLTIHLLGRPRIEVDGRDIPGPRGRKAWSLLGFLLLSDRPPVRQRLASLLFEDADDPLGALRWNLAEIRRLVGSASIGGNPIVLQLPGDAVVDVWTMTSGTWVEASQVPGIGGELLEGIDLPTAPAFDAWLFAERRRVAGLTAAVLREAATARLAGGLPETAVDLATKLVAVDDFDEDAHALLVRALVAAGDGTRAQRHVASTIERFRGELGIETSETLRRAAEPQIVSPPGPTWLRGAAAVDALITAGQAAVAAGVLEAGLEILRRSVADARAIGDPELEARALITIGTAFVHAGRGRDSEGAAALHAALAILENLDAQAMVAEAWRELGYVELKRARYERADAWLSQAVAAAPDPDSRAAALAVHGVVASDVGSTSLAVDRLVAAATDARELSKPRVEAWALAFLGRTHLLREDFAAARMALVRSIEVTRAAGWTTFLPFPQSLLATVDLAEGAVSTAAESFEAAFALGCQIGDPCWEGMAARGIGLVHAVSGRTDDAIRWLDDARTRCMRIADAYLWVHAYCLDALCAVAVAHGRQEAASWVADLENLAARTGMSEMLVRAHLHRANLGDPRSAEMAALFATRVDNPALLRLVADVAGV